MTELDPPRRNGELAFDAPWQAPVFALAHAVAEARFDGDLEPFRRQLIAAVAEDGERPYWESWSTALERLVVEAGIVAEHELPCAPRPLSAER